MTIHAEPGHGSSGRWENALRKLRSRKRIPVWGLLLSAVALVTLVSGFFIWRHAGNGDLAARRWKERDPVVASENYKHDVRPHPFDQKKNLDDKDPVKMTPDWTVPHVAVYSVSASHRHPTLRDLAERGQARAIDFLEHNSVPVEHDSTPKLPAWSALLEAMSDGSESGEGEHDPFKFDRVLVATVTKGINWDPGDRMVWTRIFVEPINFEFAGYTVAATDNASVKVTSVEATKTRKFSADLGLTLPGVEEGPKASIDPSSERSIKTTADINVQYEKLGIDIVPSFLRIIRESETGGDTVGNTMVSLSVVTDPLMIHSRYPGEEVSSRVDNNKLVLLVRGSKTATKRLQWTSCPRQVFLIVR
jgi:hypothetical protein